MNPFKEIQVVVLKRLNSNVQPVDSIFKIFLQLNRGYRAGVHFQCDFRSRKNIEYLVRGLNKPANICCIKNRWSSSSDIQCVNHQIILCFFHFTFQDIEKWFLQRQVCYRVEVAVGAFLQAERDMDVYARMFDSSVFIHVAEGPRLLSLERS